MTQSLSERLFDSSIAESWHMQAQAAFERYLDEHPTLDMIAAERMKPAFIDGFMAASRPPVQGTVSKTQVVPLDPNGVIELSRRLTPYIQGFGRHALVAPGDMMMALLIIVTTVGRQMHPHMSHQRVFEIFGPEASIVLKALDSLQSSPADETKH